MHVYNNADICWNITYCCSVYYSGFAIPKSVIYFDFSAEVTPVRVSNLEVTLMRVSNCEVTMRFAVSDISLSPNGDLLVAGLEVAYIFKADNRKFRHRAPKNAHVDRVVWCDMNTFILADRRKSQLFVYEAHLQTGSQCTLQLQNDITDIAVSSSRLYYVTSESVQSIYYTELGRYGAIISEDPNFTKLLTRHRLPGFTSIAANENLLVGTYTSSGKSYLAILNLEKDDMATVEVGPRSDPRGLVIDLEYIYVGNINAIDVFNHDGQKVCLFKADIKKPLVAFDVLPSRHIYMCHSKSVNKYKPFQL